MCCRNEARATAPISGVGADAPTTAAGAESGGRDERSRAIHRSVLAKWRPAEADGWRKRGAFPMSPRACRTLRGLHEGTPKQRSAACFRGGRKTGNCPPAAARFPPERRSAPVDARAQATDGMSDCECPSVAASRKGRVSQSKETRLRFLSHRRQVALTTMIQTKIQFNLKNAKQYFREHLGAGDYYSEGQKTKGNGSAWVPRDWV